MKKWVLAFIVFCFALAPAVSLAKEPDKKGPNQRAYEKADDNARFKRGDEKTMKQNKKASGRQKSERKWGDVGKPKNKRMKANQDANATQEDDATGGKEKREKKEHRYKERKHKGEKGKNKRKSSDE